MKRIKLLFLSIMFPAMIFAQGGVELVPFAGYMFGGSVKYSYYYGGYSYAPKLDIKDGLNYGLSILVPVQSLVDVELNWTRMDKVKAIFTSGGYPGFNGDEMYLSTNYFQIGGISKFYNSSGSIAQPFGSFSLGATWFDTSPTSESEFDSYEDVWKFSIMLGLGVKNHVLRTCWHYATWTFNDAYDFWRNQFLPWHRRIRYGYKHLGNTIARRFQRWVDYQAWRELALY